MNKEIKQIEKPKVDSIKAPKQKATIVLKCQAAHGAATISHKHVQ